MMKKLLFFLLAASVLLAFSKCNRKGLSRPDRHEKYKASPSISLLNTYIKEETDSAEALTETDHYDDKGNKIRIQHFDNKGVQMDEVLYTYDKDGNALEARTQSVDGSVLTQKNFYGKDKKLEHMEWTNTDGTSGKYLYRYDEKGEPREMDMYQDGNFMFTQATPNVYSKTGKVLENKVLVTRNTKDTMMDSRTVYRYDSLDRLTLIEYFDKYNMPEKMESYIYDSLDNRIMEVHYIAQTDNSSQDGKLVPYLRVLNTYNAYGDLTESTVYKPEGMEYVLTKKYDDYGHLVSAEFRYADGRLRTERYVYQFAGGKK